MSSLNSHVYWDTLYCSRIGREVVVFLLYKYRTALDGYMMEIFLIYYFIKDRFQLNKFKKKNGFKGTGGVILQDQFTTVYHLIKDERDNNFIAEKTNFF